MRRFVLCLALVGFSATALPLAARAGDQEIAQQLVHQLQQHKMSGALKGFDVDLQVNDGAVFLRGQVNSAEQQKLVLDTARFIPGVKTVVNAITIGATATAPAPKGPATLADMKHQPRAVIPTLRNRQPAPAPYALAQSQELHSEKPTVEAAPALDLQVAASQPVVKAVSEIESAEASEPEDQTVLIEPVRTAVPPLVVAEEETEEEPANVLASASAPLGTGVAAQPQAVQFRPVQQVEAQAPVQPVQVAQVPARQVPYGYAAPQAQAPRGDTPLAFAPAARPVSHRGMANAQAMNQPAPGYIPGTANVAPARYDHPYMPAYSWPTYAAYPNYSAVTAPKQYSPTAWPYIGPFYPYPQVPLGWRKVTLEWDDGWWMLDFTDRQ